MHYTRKILLLCYFVVLLANEEVDVNEDVFLTESAAPILIVFVASHNTTRVLMSAIVCFLADHTRVHDQVMEEQMEIIKCKDAGELMNWKDLLKTKYSRNDINEVLRLAPLGMGAFKQANINLTYAGFTIPKG